MDHNSTLPNSSLSLSLSLFFLIFCATLVFVLIHINHDVLQILTPTLPPCPVQVQVLPLRTHYTYIQ
jgi:hypothetical protein